MTVEDDKKPLENVDPRAFEVYLVVNRCLKALLSGNKQEMIEAGKAWDYLDKGDKK